MCPKIAWQRPLISAWTKIVVQATDEGMCVALSVTNPCRYSFGFAESKHGVRKGDKVWQVMHGVKIGLHDPEEC